MRSPDTVRTTSSIGTSAIVYVGLSGLQRASPFLLLPLLTRVMTPADYGAASLVTAGSLLFGVVLGSALEIPVFRWAARADDDSRSPVVLWMSQTCIYVVVPLIGIAIAGLMWFVGGTVMGVPARVWAVEILAQSLMPAANYFALPLLRATRALRRIVLITVATIISMLVPKAIFFLVLDDKLLAWVAGDLVGATVSFAVAVAVVRVTRAPVKRASARELFWFAVPLLPHRVSFWALSSLSRPALVLVGGALATVGLYSFALNVAQVAFMVVGEINRAAQPEYSRESFPAPTELTRSLARWQVLAALAVPAAVGALLAFSAPVVVGEPYRDALPMLAVLLAGQAAYGLYVIPMNYVIQSAGKTAFSWIASLSGAIAIAVGVAVFGPRNDLVGLALATAFGYGLMAVLAVAIVRVLGLTISWRTMGTGRPGIAMLVAACGCLSALTIPEYWIACTMAFASLLGCAIAAGVWRNRTTISTGRPLAGEADENFGGRQCVK